MYSFTAAYAEEVEDDIYTYHKPRVLEYVDKPDSQTVAVEYLRYAGYKNLGEDTVVLVIPHTNPHSKKLTTNTLLKILGNDFDIEKLKKVVKLYGEITNDMWCTVR